MASAGRTRGASVSSACAATAALARKRWYSRDNFQNGRWSAFTLHHTPILYAEGAKQMDWPPPPSPPGVVDLSPGVQVQVEVRLGGGITVN